MECDFNWNSALHGNAGVAALVVRNQHPELSDTVLGHALRGLPHMVRSFQPDGGYIEGVMYLGTAIGHLTDFAVPYYRLTGDDLGLLDNRDFHDTIAFWIPMWGGDGRPYNFSDVNESVELGLPHVFWWARMLGRPDWTCDTQQKLARRFGSGGLFFDIESFWYRDAFQQAATPRVPALRHFKGVDWLTWHGDHTWLAFRSGYNGGNHDNDDLGTFILGIGRERFLCDPGYGALKARQHNCATIRRQEQSDGARARILKAEELDGGFYLVCDLREAFPHVLARYRRHLLMIADRHLLVLDDILGRGATRTDVRGHLQTRLPAEVTAEGFLVRGQENTLRVRFLSDVGNLEVIPWEFQGPISTLRWTDAYHRIHTVQPILLSFGEGEFRHELTEEGFEIDLAGATGRFAAEDGQLEFRGAARA